MKEQGGKEYGRIERSKETGYKITNRVSKM